MDKEQEEQLSRLDDKQRRSKKKWIITIIIVLLVIVIGLIIYFASSRQSPTHEINKFKSDVLHKRYGNISETLSVNGNDFSKEEAKILSNYLINVKGKEEFTKQINQINHKIKNEEDYNLTDGFGDITDNKGRKILSITKDGKKMLFIDKILIEPRYTHIYLPKDKQESIYDFKYNGKTHTVQTNASKPTDMGKFVVGAYKLGSEKTYNTGAVKGTSKGNIEVNTEDFNKGDKVMAKPKYKEVSFKPELENAEHLDNNSIKIHINDHEEKYKDGKIYGKYPTSESITVYASGKISDEVFKTDTTTVDLMSDDLEQTLPLQFKEDEIKDKLKEQDEIKDKAEKFMKDYTKDLTSGYKSVEFKKVQKYFVKDSDLAKHIESMINTKKKSKYSSPTITDTKLNGDKVTLKLTKTDNKNNTIKSRYELKYDKKEDTFKIIDYTDI